MCITFQWLLTQHEDGLISPSVWIVSFFLLDVTLAASITLNGQSCTINTKDFYCIKTIVWCILSMTHWRFNLMVTMGAGDEVETFPNRWRSSQTSVSHIIESVVKEGAQHEMQLSQSLFVTLQCPMAVCTIHSSALKLLNGEHHVSCEGSYCSCYSCWWSDARTDCLNKFRCPI